MRHIHLQFIFAAFSPLLGALAHGQSLRMVEVEDPSPEALAEALDEAGFDVLHGHRDGQGHGHSHGLSPWAVRVVVDPAGFAALRSRGLSPRTVAFGRPARDVVEMDDPSVDGSVPSGYQDLAAIEARLAQTAAAHPDIAQVVDLSAAFGAPPTAEGRTIKAMKISARVSLDEDEPAVLIASAHHCREIVTPVLAMEAIDHLTDGFGNVPSITAALETSEIWIIPVVNPDGYEYVFDVNNFWRKNRRPVQGEFGIDLNRNYPQGWDNGCGGSSNPSSGTYRGDAPGSEAETQAIIALSEARRFAKVLDFHSSGREALWGYDCPSHPFDSFYQAEAAAISQAAGYGGDERRPSADGEHQQWHHGRRGAWAVLLETATQFQPSYTSALAEANQVLGAIDWLLARPVQLSGHVVDACSGAPVAAAITLVGTALPAGEENTSGGAFGRWHANVPAGTYTLRFEAPGYAATERTVQVGAAGAAILDVQLDGPGIETYCAATPNSTGGPASIGLEGSTSVTDNDVALVASGVPPLQFVLFIQGQTEIQMPLFDGFLCVSDPILRLAIVSADPLGQAVYGYDLTMPPAPTGQITAGSTWNFQAYYRDAGSGGTGANLTAGIRVPFCP